MSPIQSNSASVSDSVSSQSTVRNASTSDLQCGVPAKRHRMAGFSSSSNKVRTHTRGSSQVANAWSTSKSSARRNICTNQKNETSKEEATKICRRLCDEFGCKANIQSHINEALTTEKCKLEAFKALEALIKSGLSPAFASRVVIHNIIYNDQMSDELKQKAFEVLKTTSHCLKTSNIGEPLLKLALSSEAGQKSLAFLFGGNNAEFLRNRLCESDISYIINGSGPNALEHFQLLNQYGEELDDQPFPGEFYFFEEVKSYDFHYLKEICDRIVARNNDTALMQGSHT